MTARSIVASSAPTTTPPLGRTIRVLERLAGRSRATLIAWSILATAVIAVVDAGIGASVSLRFLYAIPVIIVTFAGGARHGIVMAAASSVIAGAVRMLTDAARVDLYLAVNLGLRIIVLSGVAVVIAELHEVAAHHRYLARHDSLTGVLSRTGFIEALDRARSRCQEDRSPLVLLHIDLNRFKLLSSERSDLTGDDVLARSASILIAATGNAEHIGRLGGDQFVVMLPGSTMVEARSVSQRVRRSAIAWAGDGTRLGPSVRIALFTRMPGTTDALVSAADGLVYANADEVERSDDWP
jgi:diguanylate cyclase (GGDEF)-like protein